MEETHRWRLQTLLKRDAGGIKSKRKPRSLGNHASQIKKVTKERYQEFMVALTESIMKNWLQRILTQD